ncbi:hypothetical protein Gotur_005762 [Gossypium turneri]
MFHPNSMYLIVFIGFICGIICKLFLFRFQSNDLSLFDQSMQMVVFVSIFYKISGVLYMMLPLYSLQFSLFFVIRTRTLQQTRKRLVCLVRISGNTTEECAK